MVKKRAKVVESSPSPSPKKSKSKLKEISFIKPPEVFGKYYLIQLLKYDRYNINTYFEFNFQKIKKVNPYDEDSLSINSFDDNVKDPDFILKCKCV